MSIDEIRERDDSVVWHDWTSQAARDRHTLLVEIDRLQGTLTARNAGQIECERQLDEQEGEIDRLTGLQSKWAEETSRAERHRAVAEIEAGRLKAELAVARTLIDSGQWWSHQNGVDTERARCIAAIEASCMICPECIVEAVKVIEADA